MRRATISLAKSAPNIRSSAAPLVADEETIRSRAAASLLGRGVLNDHGVVLHDY